MAYYRASRPKVAKLVSNLALREKVEHDLEKRYSPEQITGRLRVEFPDDSEMRVSPETIYQSLYVQSRGALRRDLAVCLRTGRALRRPSRKVGQRKNRIPNMINIAERPAEVEDRAVPGNWESQCFVKPPERRSAVRSSTSGWPVAVPRGRRRGGGRGRSRLGCGCVCWRASSGSSRGSGRRASCWFGLRGRRRAAVHGYNAGGGAGCRCAGPSRSAPGPGRRPRRG